MTINADSSESTGIFPHHFVTFVEILFAVVLGASLLNFHTILFPPDLRSPSFWAVLAVYFTAVSSWMGWHKSTSEYPYTQSRAGYLRSVTDALIVATYAGLLFFGSRLGRPLLLATQHDSLRWYLWGFVLVFLLYYASGKLRTAEHAPQASKPYLIRRHGAIVLVAAIVYTVLSTGSADTTGLALWVFVTLPFFAMLSFRWYREWRHLPWTAKTKERPTIAVDMDGVLVEQVIPVLEKLQHEMNVDLCKDTVTDWQYPIGETNIKIEIEKAERDEAFVRHMPPIEGARQALAILSGRFNIVVATSRETVTDEWSHNWLDSHGIPYDRLVNTRSTGKALPDIDLLIDDHIANVAEFIGSGFSSKRAILFAQPWNHDTSGIAKPIALGKVRIAHSWASVLFILARGLPS